MPGKKHTHKYHKIQMGEQKVWACALGGDCCHYMPKYMEHMIPGRKSICWECGDEMLLNALNMQHDKPKCDDCSQERDLVHALMEKLG